MSKSIPIVFALSILCGVLSSAVADQDATAELFNLFNQLLSESGMEFTPPEGFTTVPVQSNPLFPYEHAIRSANGALEIRYALRPLSRIEVDYQDPHSSTPDPNHMFPLMFQSMVTSLANGSHSPTREYTAEQAQTQFNASWAAAAVFDVHTDFNTEYGQAFVLALHKNQLADAYAFLLFDNVNNSKESIKANLNALRFLP